MTPKPRDDAPKGLKYSVLEDEHRRQILRERIERIENEYYNHEVNLTLANEHLGNGMDEAVSAQIEQTYSQMISLERAHATVSAELIKLGS